MDNEIILIHGPSGNAYKIDVEMGDAFLVCSPLLAKGGWEDDNWSEVDFSRGLDEEQTQVCRSIEAALNLVLP